MCLCFLTLLAVSIVRPALLFEEEDDIGTSAVELIPRALMDFDFFATDAAASSPTDTKQSDLPVWVGSEHRLSSRMRTELPYLTAHPQTTYYNVSTNENGCLCMIGYSYLLNVSVKTFYSRHRTVIDSYNTLLSLSPVLRLSL